MSVIGRRILECRKKAKLSQEELGEKLGVQKSAVSKWETAKVTNIDDDKINKMSKIFEVSPMWLHGYDVPKNLRDSEPFANLTEAIEALSQKYESFDDIPQAKLDALSVVAQEAALLKLHQMFLLK